MFLQPQTNEQGKMLGAEALVRWQHPERGLLESYAFIDVLEKTGLIHELDKYMWEQAAKKLGEWKKRGKKNIIYRLIFLQRIFILSTFIKSWWD